MKQNFINTSDYDTYLILKELGFQEVQSSNNNIYTFLNCKSVKFSESDDIDKTKIQYSNMLCI